MTALDVNVDVRGGYTASIIEGGALSVHSFTQGYNTQASSLGFSLGNRCNLFIDPLSQCAFPAAIQVYIGGDGYQRHGE